MFWATEYYKNPKKSLLSPSYSFQSAEDLTNIFSKRTAGKTKLMLKVPFNTK